MAAGQQAIEQLAPPALVVDLRTCVATASGHVMPLPGASFLWFATLAQGMARDADDGWVASAGRAPLRAIARAAGTSDWWRRNVRSKSWKALRAHEGPVDTLDLWEPSLRKGHADCRRVITAWCAAHAPGWARWLVPEMKTVVTDTRASYQRLTLHPERINVLG